MTDINKHATNNLFTWIKNKVLTWLHLSHQPLVQLYHGYGNGDKAFIFGHAFKIGSTSRKRYRKNYFSNGIAMVGSFLVKPWPTAKLRLVWGDLKVDCVSEDDGYFRFEWLVGKNLGAGWHPVIVQLLHPENEQILATGEGVILIPFKNQYGIISDIDDTFLISHSPTIFKRLYVLLTKNAHNRKPFDDVVKHYQLLGTAGTVNDLPNPFFYVSSSEWNLYNFIREFAIQNELPKGVYFLSQLKSLAQLIQSGQNKHQAKFAKIVRIIEAYPGKKFILLGDDSQEDPFIYAAIVKHFPGKIIVVYLRRVHKPNETEVLKQVNYIIGQQVPCCYFSHSREAIRHSKEMGLIESI